MLRRRLFVLVFILAAAVFFLPSLISLLVDWWWFQEIGYQVVFTRELIAKALLFFVVGGISFALLYLNLRIAQRGLVPDPVVFRIGQSTPKVDVNRAVLRMSLPLSLFIGLMAGLAATASWQTVLRFIYGVPFGITDPIFSRDIGFYGFTLPGIGATLGLLTTLAMLSLILVVPIYVIRGDIVVTQGLPRVARGGRRSQTAGLRVEPSAGLHIAILLAAIFLLLALRLWLVDAPELLYSTTGPMVGASYTDLHARLPALRVSTVVAVLSALAVLIGAFRRQLPRYTLLAFATYLGVALIGRGVYPAIMQKFVVSPTELTREAPYLRHHIAATRAAWGLDSVEVRELSAEPRLTLADVRANAPTIENVRLWDRAPLLQTFGAIQEIRTYYDFVSVDDDRYLIDGRYRQVLLSPRELNAASLPTRTFINEHLTFTHGMGLTLGPVNEVTPEGLPVLFVKDLPPVSSVSLKISRPQIYYGELTDPYVFVNTRQPELDHPSGEKNVYTNYKGKGGVPVGNILRRAILAAHFGSSKILFSGDITSGSRVLYNRSVANRARKALPFLLFDRDPYLVIAGDGTLKWILDAYTATTRYPYAQNLRDGTNYLRNSVKLVIDAYDGTLTAYVSAPHDPLIKTWSRIFPGIFVSIDNMPADLRAHVRYPTDIYRIQTGLYTTYHMDAVEDFYHREDQWQIPAADKQTESLLFMRHIVMRLPEEKQAEYIYMVPFTPRGKDNLAAWMVARNDGEVYGKLRVYRLGRQSLVFGPRQIENRINQDTEIARQVALWDQRGSQVIRGELLVIPIEESVLYVQPLYLRAEGGRIPELKRVVVAFQNRVVMRETLDEGLAQLFGGTAGPRRLPEPAVAAATAQPATGDSRTESRESRVASLAQEARRRYDAAIQAQRELDWARYGEEMKRLGEVLEQLGR